MTDAIQITYLFDPLCGWCYGASGIIRQLSELPGVDIELAPTGLFSGNGARRMDAQFAVFAWSNDQRISKLTGQKFTQDYREKVLNKVGGLFDSGAATLALSAVYLTAPSSEIAALRLIQEARYVLGLDITERTTLVGILDEGGLGAAAARLSAPDEELLAANRTRVTSACAIRDEFRVDGVPAVIIDDGQDRRLIRANELLGSADMITKLLRSKASAAGAGL